MKLFLDWVCTAVKSEPMFTAVQPGEEFVQRVSTKHGGAVTPSLEEVVENQKQAHPKKGFSKT